MDASNDTASVNAIESSPRVLVVDDDLDLTRALKQALLRQGLTVEVVHDGASALERVDSDEYDVMVLDLRLGGMDGLEVLRQGYGNPKWPATILHSAYLDVPTTVLVMRAGVAEVLEKPTSASVLAQRIRELSTQSRTRRFSGVQPVVKSSAWEDASKRLLGDSACMAGLRQDIERVARFGEMSVLIEGPTGTGKELVAGAIHAASSPDQPFVSLNCAAVPAHLFESELFGHDAGAFTSARGARAGLLEEAGRGTLFLDEVGEMPSALQPKLLRVLESREFRRVGSNRMRKFNARVVSATNQPLSKQSGEVVRSDLYFRLAGYTILTPPLVQRLDDIPVLARNFLAQFCDRHRTRRIEISDAAVGVLCAHDWPGNVRELRIVVEKAAVLSHDGVVDRAEVSDALGARTPAGSGSVEGMPPSLASLGPNAPSLPDLERELILRAFFASGKNLSRAARELGIPRSTLRDKLKKYGAR